MLGCLRALGAVAIIWSATASACLGDTLVLDWLDDSKRPGVRGCGDVLYSYDPMLRYVPGEDRAAPGTTPEQQNAFVSRIVDAIAEAAKWKAANGRKPQFNVLALSGGGQWGAYGAGFLNGWAAADARLGGSTDHIRRDDIDLITGISTGSMQLTFAYLGSSSDPAVRTRAAEDLKAEFLDPNIGDLVDKRLPTAILTSNALFDVDGLVSRVRGRIGNDLSLYRAMPARQRLYAGTVNLDDGKFAIVDLKTLVDRPDAALPDKTKRSCMAASILSSAAVPLAFPPRFIDGKMYVDGGARFGLFSSIIFRNPKIKAALLANGLTLSVSVIINGNQSSASYADDGNKPVDNGFFAIAGAAMGNVLDQLYKDSAYRNEADLYESYSEAYASRYTYVPNDDIRSAPAGSPCADYKRRMAEDQFDPKFMRCLYEIGESRWNNTDPKKIWKEFSQVPVK